MFVLLRPTGAVFTHRRRRLQLFLLWLSVVSNGKVTSHFVGMFLALRKIIIIIMIKKNFFLSSATHIFPTSLSTANKRKLQNG